MSIQESTTRKQKKRLLSANVGRGAMGCPASAGPRAPGSSCRLIVEGRARKNSWKWLADLLAVPMCSAAVHRLSYCSPFDDAARNGRNPLDENSLALYQILWCGEMAVSLSIPLFQHALKKIRLDSKQQSVLPVCSVAQAHWKSAVLGQVSIPQLLAIDCKSPPSSQVNAMQASYKPLDTGLSKPCPKTLAHQCQETGWNCWNWWKMIKMQNSSLKWLEREQHPQSWKVLNTLTEYFNCYVGVLSKSCMTL